MIEIAEEVYRINREVMDELSRRFNGHNADLKDLESFTAAYREKLQANKIINQYYEIGGEGLTIIMKPRIDETVLNITVS